MARALSEDLYFFVILESEAQARTTALVEKLQLIHGVGGKPVQPDRRHITLASLGSHREPPRELVEAAKRTAAKIQFESFPVEFDHVAGARSLVMLGGPGLSPLRLFQRHLISEMRHGPLLPFARKPFAPHVTLIYGAGLPQTPIDPIRWRVRDFALIQSRNGLTEHRLLGHWPLETPAAPRSQAA